MLHTVFAMWDDAMVLSSIIGVLVLIYSVEDGIFMVYDKVRYGKPFLDA